MKILIFIGIGVAICGAWAGTLLFAFSVGVRIAAKENLAKLGMTKAKVELFARAAKLINRLAQLTDLDGAMAGDVLSPVTKQQATEWVTDYKREISKR